MVKAKAPEQIAREIVEIPVDEEMRDSFMPYALSVTTSRAIPDVRDGLKPVPLYRSAPNGSSDGYGR